MVRYDPLALPVVGREVPGRPCYLPMRELVDRQAAGGWLSVWRVGARVTTIETRSHAMLRPLDPWGRDFDRAAAWWTARQLRAPSSPAGLIREAAPEWYRPTTYTSEGWARVYLRGGWQEASVRGVIAGPHRLYDLRRAYRWALTAAELPDRRTMTVARQWHPTWPGLHLVDLDPWPAAPWPLRDGGLQLVETPEDVVRYGPPPVRRWIQGTYWHRTIPATALGERIDSTGVAACARSYWGTWVATTPTTRTYHTGTVTSLRPRGTDAVRGHLIMARVRRRLAEQQAPYKYVDSVITTHPLATGDGPGDWRLVREYPDGVWIGWPGAYGPPGARPDRHAGLSLVQEG